MISAVNAILECLMTAVFVCFILYWLARLGMMPMIIIDEQKAKEFEEGEQE